jgi:GntR family transcriptional regulator
MNNQVTTSQRLHENLGQVIATAKPGERLPSEPDLARQLGVSRASLREAMRTFETQGLIRRQQGVGTFVLRPSHVLESGLEVLESIETLARRIGLEVRLGELRVEQRQAKENEAEALGLAPGAEVISISRVILAEERPVAYLIDVLPVGVLNPEDLAGDFNGSVLDLLIKKGTPPLMDSLCDIGAVAASSDIARALNIQRGDALLFFNSCLYAVDGRNVDYSFSYFLPGYFRFHVVRELEKSERPALFGN